MSDLKSRYKVEWLIDDTYQVLKCYWDERTVDFMESYGDDVFDFDFNEEVMFKGSLVDCNAWLQLNDKGYMQ